MVGRKRWNEGEVVDKVKAGERSNRDGGRGTLQEEEVKWQRM